MSHDIERMFDCPEVPEQALNGRCMVTATIREGGNTMSDTSAGQPVPEPVAPTPSPAAAPGRATIQLSLPPWPIVTMIVAAILVLIGSILPWVTASTIFGTFSQNGTSGDGVITLISAILAAGLALAYVARPNRWWILGSGLAFAIVTAVGIYDMTNLPTLTANQARYVSVSIGSGLWLCVIGAVIGLGAAVWFVLHLRASEGAET